ncbi:dihydrofolate reductase family protein [Kocuria sabuli]|uniref:dihydrofolate reductase family protein n=1 Tax=Kocuria sabuli TaxID=3071448 RepID=UPI0034D76E24
MTTIYYAAGSLDGFIADPGHSLDWLLTRDVDGSGPMGIDTFLPGVGAMAMGATTYRWIRENLPGGWPYTVPCWVFTHHRPERPDGADVQFTAEDVADVHEQMVGAAAGQHVWIVGGGELAGQFADRGLLDELWVQWAPVTLGGGAPLLPRRLEFRYEELVRNGEFACARLSVVR